MKNRFRKTIIINEDEIKEIDDNTLKYQRYILLAILFQHILIFWIFRYTFAYTYQILLQLYLKYKITIIVLISIILFISDLFKHKLKRQPLSTLLYFIFIFSISFLFIVYGNNDIEMQLISNIFPLFGWIISSFFQKREFQYVQTFTFILTSQLIFIIIVIFQDLPFNLALICSFITFIYLCFILHQFKNDLLYEIEEYSLFGSIQIYTLIFKQLFTLLEAISGEFNI